MNRQVMPFHPSTGYAYSASTGIHVINNKITCDGRTPESTDLLLSDSVNPLVRRFSTTCHDLP